MLNTDQCAEYLEVHKNTVIYYLKNNYLKGILIDGKYQIASKDLETFESQYYTNDKIKNKRGTKSFNMEDYSSLSEIVEAVKKGMTIDELVEHYSQVEIKIPSQIVYNRFKRNRDIRRLKKDGYTVPYLANKFGLSIPTVENIVYSK